MPRSTRSSAAANLDVLAAAAARENEGQDDAARVRPERAAASPQRDGSGADDAEAAGAAPAEATNEHEGDGASSNDSRSSRGQHGPAGRPYSSPRPSARKRQSTPPSRLDPEGPKDRAQQKAGARQARRDERKRQRDVETRVNEHVPDRAFMGDAQITARNIANNTASKCCGAGLLPVAPAWARGSHALTFIFTCITDLRLVESSK